MNDRVKKMNEIEGNARNIKKAVPAKPEELTAVLLRFLQKEKLVILKTVAGLKDIKLGEDPPRLLLDMPAGLTLPELEFEGMIIPVELDSHGKNSVFVEQEDNEEGATKVVVDEEGEKQSSEVFTRSIGGDAAKSLGITEAPGPHSMVDSSNESKSYKEWVKRHPGVKIGNEE